VKGDGRSQFHLGAKEGSDGRRQICGRDQVAGDFSTEIEALQVTGKLGLHPDGPGGLAGGRGNCVLAGERRKIVRTHLEICPERVGWQVKVTLEEKPAGFALERGFPDDKFLLGLKGQLKTEPDGAADQRLPLGRNEVLVGRTFTLKHQGDRVGDRKAKGRSERAEGCGTA